MAISTLHGANPDLSPDTPESAPAAELDHRRGGRRRRARVLRPLSRPNLRTASVVVLLAGTAVLYLWDLAASGYANTFYSAAVQAGSQSWKAFLFGSLDAGNSITVDKPPASLWLMALSVRIFGLSSWSILAPQALLGVATVGVLFASVRRTSGHVAGLAAGALLALTPAAALMFRYNNPDALLVLLLTAAGYLTLRATEKASARWLAGAGVLVGFAFLTKMLQAFLVLPAFALVYLIAAPTSVRRRIWHLLIAFATMIVSLGWWVALVELTPASLRPYVGGSQTNSELELIFGYNGLARLVGNGGGAGPGGGPGGGGSFGSYTGITRLFEGASGGMISWLIPAALVLGALALALLRRSARTNLVRAAVLLWSGWLVVTALVFSFMAGIYHDYYTVALAPAIAGLVAVGGHVVWTHRDRLLARIGFAVAALATGAWGFVLINAAPQPYNALKWLIAAASLAGALGFLVAHRLPSAAAATAVAVALVGAGTGPTAYALDTVTTPHAGPIVTAGPVSGGEAGPGGQSGPFRQGRFGRADGSVPGGVPGQQGGPTVQQGGPTGQGQQAGPTGQGGPGGMDQQTVSTDLTTLLNENASAFSWVAATNGTQAAARFQLATELPVMAIGGFNGGDPSPTLAQFQAYVAQGKIHYYIAGGEGPGGGRGPGGSQSTGSAIASWVAQNFTAKTVGGVTVYDLTAGN
jgi:4-amino-4-deoxy-L-arabinose transferase-like glycosyltransferase